MDWNKYQENILKKWSSMSKTYSTIHSIAAGYYNTWDKRLGIPVILLGDVAASSIYLQLLPEKKLTIYGLILMGGMVLLMNGISGVSKFLGTNEKQQIQKRSLSLFINKPIIARLKNIDLLENHLSNIHIVTKHIFHLFHKNHH